MYLITPVADLSLSAGAERAQLALCRELAGLGHQVHVVYRTDGWFRDEWSEFADAIEPMSPGVAGMCQLRSVIARHRAGRSRPIVYAHHNGSWNNLTVGFSARAAFSARVAVHMHLPYGGNVHIPALALRVIASVPDLTVYVSEDTRRTWEAAGATARVGATVHNGIDTSRHLPSSDHARAEARDQLGIPRDRLVVLMLGRLVEQKGVLVLLQAWRHLMLTEGADTMHLLFVGTAGSSTITQAIRQSPRTTLVPWLRDVGHAYDASDAVVVPSTWNEPFPLTLLEALAREKTVVWSTVGGIPEELGDWGAHHGEWAVPPGDAQALATALLELRRTPASVRAAIGKSGRRYVQQHRSVEAWGAAIEQLLLAYTRGSSGLVLSRQGYIRGS